jgi:hypothetical protein
MIKVTQEKTMTTRYKTLKLDQKVYVRISYIGGILPGLTVPVRAVASLFESPHISEAVACALVAFDNQRLSDLRANPGTKTPACVGIEFSANGYNVCIGVK